MKKVLSLMAIALFTVGLFSCEAESTTSQEDLYIDSPDGHDKGTIERN